MFEHLKDAIERMVSVGKSRRKRDLDLANHEVYRIARTACFVGGQDKLSQLDAAFNRGRSEESQIWTRRDKVY